MSSNINSFNLNQQAVDNSASVVQTAEVDSSELSSVQTDIAQAAEALLQARTGEATTQQTNLNAAALADIDSLLEGDTLEEQVKSFRDNTIELQRKSDLSQSEVEDNGELAKELDSLLEASFTAISRRDRRRIRRSQDFLEKRFLKTKLKELANKAGTLVQSDAEVNATDIEELQNSKQELRELVEKHEGSFFVKHYDKKFNMTLSVLKQKFIKQLQPEMKELSMMLKDLIDSGEQISEEKYE